MPQLRIFPDKEGVRPRYTPKSFDIENQINTFVNNFSAKNNNDKNALCSCQKTFFN